MTKTVDADKIGSKNLKLNADNIKSVLVKNTKIMSRLKTFKSKKLDDINNVLSFLIFLKDSTLSFLLD